MQLRFFLYIFFKSTLKQSAFIVLARLVGSETVVANQLLVISGRSFSRTSEIGRIKIDRIDAEFYAAVSKSLIIKHPLSEA